MRNAAAAATANRSRRYQQQGFLATTTYNNREKKKTNKHINKHDCTRNKVYIKLFVFWSRGVSECQNKSMPRNAGSYRRGSGRLLSVAVGSDGIFGAWA